MMLEGSPLVGHGDQMRRPVDDFPGFGALPQAREQAVELDQRSIPEAFIEPFGRI